MRRHIGAETLDHTSDSVIAELEERNIPMILDRIAAGEISAEHLAAT